MQVELYNSLLPMSDFIIVGGFEYFMVLQLFNFNVIQEFNFL